jgi:hypothetical protein
MTTLEMTPVGAARVHVATAVPGYAFQCELPRDWLEYAVADLEPDFQDPGAFRPLAHFASDDGLLHFSVGVRPIYMAGNLADWLAWLGGNQLLALAPIAPLRVGPLLAASCLATAETESGLTALRLALCEDGQSLFLLSAAAPLELFDAMGPVLTQLVASFTLVAGRGQTVPAM